MPFVVAAAKFAVFADTCRTMKRFSAREFAFLTLPVVLIAGVGLWASRRPKLVSSAIAVQVAQVVQPRPVDVARGADVAVRLKLNERPDDNTLTNWKTGFRVRAGKRLVWSDAKGDAVRAIGVESRVFDGAWHEWNGAFDLKNVPASWGQVVLEWDAELRHPRRTWGHAWMQTTRRQGRIMLRAAGQNLATPAVSHDPHLRLVETRIARMGTIRAGTDSGKPTFKVTLKFERVATALSGDVKAVLYSLAVLHPQKGVVSHINNASEEFMGLGKSRQFTQCSYSFIGAPDAANLRMNWIAQQGNYWPLSGTLPLTNGKGQLLIATQQYPR